MFVNGAVGGMQSPLGSMVKDAQGKLLAENTFEKAEFIGKRVATLAAEALEECAGAERQHARVP